MTKSPVLNCAFTKREMRAQIKTIDEKLEMNRLWLAFLDKQISDLTAAKGVHEAVAESLRKQRKVWEDASK